MFGGIDMMDVLKAAGVLYATDLIITPQFGRGAIEVVKFFIDGYVINAVLGYGKDCQCEGDPVDASQDKTISRAIVTGLTVWISDLILQPEIFRGLGSEMFKFLIQGFIVAYVLDSYGA